MEILKECRLCGLEKSLDKFRSARRTRQCMACESKRDKKKKRVDSRVYILEIAKTRATKVGRPFDITIDDIVIPTHCPIMGIPIFYTQGRPTDNSPSLDRVVNELGYVRGNVRVISRFANWVKGARSKEELLSFAHNLIAYLA